MAKDRDYRDRAEDDAWEAVEHFMDEIAEQIAESGEASDDMSNDYPDGDSYHHESHVDRWYDLTDAAQILDELSEYEETDGGLWDGREPRDAIAAQAAFTYGNAVYDLWRDRVREVNDYFDPLPGWVEEADCKEPFVRLALALILDGRGESTEGRHAFTRQFFTDFEAANEFDWTRAGVLLDWCEENGSSGDRNAARQWREWWQEVENAVQEHQGEAQATDE